MKNALLLILLSNLSLQASGQVSLNDLGREKLLGKIASIKTTVEAASPTTKLRLTMKQTACNYDTTGWLLSEIDSNHFTNNVTYRFKYDNHNQLLEKGTYSTDGKLYQKEIFSILDKQSIRQDFYNITDDGTMVPLSYAVCFFDEWRNLIESDYYGSDGKISSKQIFKYDVNGNQTSRRMEIGNNDSMVSSTNSEYDLLNRKVKEITIFVNSVYNTHYTYRYPTSDHIGNWITQNCYEGTELRLITTRKITYYP